jgi:diaminopropionate ammonia-lyase
MCCGTLSATAWPILKDGVNVAVTVDDIEVDKAIVTLEGFGIRAGPCGAASLSALRSISQGLPRAYLGQQAVVVILCTEAARKYQMKG